MIVFRAPVDADAPAKSPNVIGSPRALFALGAAFVPLAAFVFAVAPPARPARPAEHITTLAPLHHICAVASTQTTAPPISISACVLILSTHRAMRGRGAMVHEGT